MEKHEKKRWRGGAIYLREDGTIDRVVDGKGNKITPEKEKKHETHETKGTSEEPIIVMRGSKDDPEDRCIYTLSGDCYCT